MIWIAGVIVLLGLLLAVQPAGAQSLGGFVSGLVGKLGASDIAVYAQNAGFSGDDLTTAVAIALAESGGNPSAVGDLAIVKPNGSIGLWQINTNAHPEYDPAQLTDPQYNANAAYAIYQRAGGFRPWSTFTSGNYMAYLADASNVVNA